MGSISYFFEECGQNLHDFFLECLVDYTSEALWAYNFLDREVLSHKSNFCNRCPVEVIHSLQSELEEYVVFQAMCSFHVSGNIHPYQIVKNFLTILF